MLAPAPVPLPPLALWGVVHPRSGAGAPRFDLFTAQELAQAALGLGDPDGTAQLRLTRFVEAPIWRSAAEPPPPARPREPWEFEAVSHPVLVVVEERGGTRRQLVATYRVDEEEPHRRSWRSDCADGWELERVVAWRELDWPAP